MANLSAPVIGICSGISIQLKLRILSWKGSSSFPVEVSLGPPVGILLPNRERETENETRRSLEKEREIEPQLYFNYVLHPTSRSITWGYSFMI